MDETLLFSHIFSPLLAKFLLFSLFLIPILLLPNDTDPSVLYGATCFPHDELAAHAETNAVRENTHIWAADLDGPTTAVLASHTRDRNSPLVTCLFFQQPLLPYSKIACLEVTRRSVAGNGLALEGRR